MASLISNVLNVTKLGGTNTVFSDIAVFTPNSIVLFEVGTNKPIPFLRKSVATKVIQNIVSFNGKRGASILNTLLQKEVDLSNILCHAGCKKVYTISNRIEGVNFPRAPICSFKPKPGGSKCPKKIRKMNC